MSMFGAKVEIAAIEKGIAFELEMVPFDIRHGYEPKHLQVTRINPKQQVPVLVHGVVELFDSTQIFEYLEDRWPDPPLYPRAIEARAQARLLEHCSDEVFFPNVVVLMTLRGEPDPVDSPEWQQAHAQIANYYAKMDLLLENRDFLANVMTYADIAFYVAQFFASRHTASITSSFPRLITWRTRMSHRPSVTKVMGAMATYLRAINLPVPEFWDNKT